MFQRIDPKKFDNPLSWDCMLVTDLLMNAASHLGMNYAAGRFVPSPYDSRDPQGFDQASRLDAARICDHFAWLHNWIKS